MAKKESQLKKIKSVVAEYKTQLAKDIVIDKIFLFGSAARGRMKKDSEIDISEGYYI